MGRKKVDFAKAKDLSSSLAALQQTGSMVVAIVNKYAGSAMSFMDDNARTRLSLILISVTARALSEGMLNREPPEVTQTIIKKVITDLLDLYQEEKVAAKKELEAEKQAFLEGERPDKETDPKLN